MSGWCLTIVCWVSRGSGSRTDVRNVLERILPASPARVGPLVDSLASPKGGLWPPDRWPAMRFERPLGVGSPQKGGVVSLVSTMRKALPVACAAIGISSEPQRR